MENSFLAVLSVGILYDPGIDGTAGVCMDIAVNDVGLTF